MAVLKANGSFLKSNGKILVRPEGGLADFLYLTYFENFDEGNGTDIPIIGNATQFTNYAPNIFKKTNLDGMPALRTNAFDQTWHYYKFLENVDDEIISLESFLVSYGTGNEGQYFGFEGNSDTDLYYSADAKLIIRYSNSPRMIFCRYWSFTTYNGASYSYSGQRIGYTIPNQIYGKKIHYAVVIDKTNKEGRLYVDGILYMWWRNGIADFFETLRLGVYSNQGDQPTVFTQLAVRKGDRSINDGMNYPVPQTPYYPSILNN